MELEEEVLILRKILRRSTSPKWWARLSYRSNDQFWTDDEQEVLARAFSDK